MLHTEFLENRPAGSENKLFKDFTIYVHGGHLGHVTSIVLINFHFLVPESFQYKLWFKMAQ